MSRIRMAVLSGTVSDNGGSDRTRSPGRGGHSPTVAV